jgi:hypothetical protein
MRGRRRRSATWPRTSPRPKILSEYRISRWRTGLFLSLLQALPLQIGEFFNQLFHLLLILDRLPHAVFPLARHEHLAQLPSLASDQIQTGMQFSSGAMTAGFATTDISDGESAAQKASGVDDLRETRSLLPFPGREL